MNVMISQFHGVETNIVRGAHLEDCPVVFKTHSKNRLVISIISFAWLEKPTHIIEPTQAGDHFPRKTKNMDSQFVVFLA